jgi:hypothetical protein
MFSCIHTEQSQWAQPLLALSMIEHQMRILPAKRDALYKAVCPHLSFDVFTGGIRIGVNRETMPMPAVLVRVIRSFLCDTAVCSLPIQFAESVSFRFWRRRAARIDRASAGHCIVRSRLRQPSAAAA